MKPISKQEREKLLNKPTKTISSTSPTTSSGCRGGDRFTVQEKIRALVKWTNNGWSGINGALFGEKSINEGIQRIIAQIDEALADHTTSKAFTVDRLMDVRTFGASNIADLFHLTPGQTFTHEEFMATSLNRGGVEATPSQRVATRILVSSGEHAAFLENITRYLGEKEILSERERWNL